MGRNPKCKTCTNIICTNGDCHFCKKTGKEINPDTSFDCEFYNKAQKPKKTAEELSLARSMAGKAGAAARGSGWGRGRTPKVTLSVNEFDHVTFSCYSRLCGLSITAAFHSVCEKLKAAHPKLVAEIEKENP